MEIHEYVQTMDTHTFPRDELTEKLVGQFPLGSCILGITGLLIVVWYLGLNLHKALRQLPDGKVFCHGYSTHWR